VTKTREAASAQTISCIGHLADQIQAVLRAQGVEKSPQAFAAEYGIATAPTMPTDPSILESQIEQTLLQLDTAKFRDSPSPTTGQNSSPVVPEHTTADAAAIEQVPQIEPLPKDLSSHQSATPEQTPTANPTAKQVLIGTSTPEHSTASGSAALVHGAFHPATPEQTTVGSEAWPQSTLGPATPEQTTAGIPLLAESALSHDAAEVFGAPTPSMNSSYAPATQKVDTPAGVTVANAVLLNQLKYPRRAD
jgi:hypothetical protein